MKPDPVDIRVGAHVRAQRLLSGMSQETFARRLGISFQQLQKYERGTDRISASRLYRMAMILGVPIDDFFDHPDHELLPPTVKREGLELVRAFRRIGSPSLRRLLCGLVRHLAGETA